MTTDALANLGTILCVALAGLAGAVLIRSRRTDAFLEGEGCGDAGELPGHDADGRAWKLRVLCVAHRRSTIVVAGTPVHVEPGDVLMALRAERRGSESAVSRLRAESAAEDVPHAS